MKSFDFRFDSPRVMLRVTSLVNLCLVIFTNVRRCDGFARSPYHVNFLRKPRSHGSVKSLGTASSNAFNTNPVSLSQYLDLQTSYGNNDGSVHCVLNSMADACKDIAGLMRRVMLDRHDGFYRNEDGTEVLNTQGELQQKLDVISNQIMKAAVCKTGHVGLMISEEDEKPCSNSEISQGAAPTGGYVAVFDPLDGSSNIDSGLPTGTIFGIYRSPSTSAADLFATAMKPGKELVAAGYCLYSAATHLVITLRRGVFMFTLDDETNQFILTRSNLQIPSVGSLYTFNDAYSGSWSTGLTRFVQDFRSNAIPGVTLKKPSARYVGALVADAHNVLLHGGVFGYPALPSRPVGKLRLVYEANPLAALMEDAGGSASDGSRRILELGVHDIHQRTPLYFGSKDVVIALEEYIKD